MTENQNSQPSLRTLVELLSAIPRVKDRTATTIALHFLLNPPAWAAFRTAMDTMNNLGWCVCGNIPMDSEQKANGRYLCDFCRQTERSGIVIVPDIPTMYRLEDLAPERYWYHLVRTGSDQEMTEDLQWFVNNYAHKTKLHGAPPAVINGLGNDENSLSCMSVIGDILREDMGLDTDNLVVSLPIGIPLGQSLSRTDDMTLLRVLENLSSK